MKYALNRPIIIGIDGLGGSGKTTVASYLQSRFTEAIVLHLDDFIYQKAIRYQPQFEEWYCYYYLQWRTDYLIKKILEPLKEGKRVKETIEFYDKETDSYHEKLLEIPRNTILIVEGVFLQRPSLRSYLDFVVFVDVPLAERTNRVMKRDTYIGDAIDITRKYETRYFPAERHYIEKWKPKERANYVLSNYGNS